MDVQLTPELERLIREKVAAGHYGSPDDVVREAVRLLIRRDEEHKARLEALRRDVRVGLDQLDRGEGIPLDEALIDHVLSEGRIRRQLRKPA